MRRENRASSRRNGGPSAFTLAAGCDLLKSPRRLRAENLFLRHQLNIALRRARPRPRLSQSDRVLLVWMTFALSRVARVSSGREARGHPALASGRLPRLLALEIAEASRAAEDRPRFTRPDQTDESGEPIVGRTWDSWQIIDAWVPHWICAPRVPRPRAGLRRGTSEANSRELCNLLQSGAHAPSAGQERTAQSSHPAVWKHCCDTRVRRSASSIWPDIIFGRDRQE